MEPEDEETWAKGAVRLSLRRALETLSRDFAKQALGIEVPKPKKMTPAQRKAWRERIAKRAVGDGQEE
jgi:hypothetical protein